MIKIIHTADLHLGHIYRGLEAKKASILRNELKKTLKEITLSAQNKEVDFLIISGDLFEGDIVSLSTVNYVNECFEKIKDTEIIILPGNNDPYTDNSVYKRYDWNDNVKILTGKYEKITYENKNTVFYGNGFNDNKDKEKFVFDYEKPSENTINVLVMHGTVDMIYTKKPINEATSQEIDKIGFDYVALGHYHSRMENYKNCDKIYNPGSPYPLSEDDGNDNGYYYIELDKDSIEDTFISLDSRKYYKFDVSVEGTKSNSAIINKIEEKVSHKDRKNNLYKIFLTGKIGRDFALDIKAIAEKLENDIFHIEIYDRTRLDIDLDNLLTEPGLKGSFVRKIYNRILREKNEDEKRNLYKGLYNGLKTLQEEENDAEE